MAAVNELEKERKIERESETVNRKTGLWGWGCYHSLCRTAKAFEMKHAGSPSANQKQAPPAEQCARPSRVLVMS